MDSTSQMGHDGADWQEEIYLKIQAMKEANLADLQEMHLKMSQRYNEMLTLAKRPDYFEKLKNYKLLVERMIAFLQISKSNITINLKDRLPSIEKYILQMSNTFRRQAQKQLQHPVGHAHSTPQHQPSQVLQVQQHENHGNQVPLSAVTSRMQHGSMTLATLADPATQKNATNSVQSASELDHVQVNSFSSLQQGLGGSVQQIGVGPLQNSISPAQQTNLNNLNCASMDPTAQTGHNGADWQEEIYRKIQAMKEAHLADLQEMHLKMSQRYNEMLPLAKRPDYFEKLKNYKLLVERMIAFLQISKSNITINLKDRLPSNEKYILQMSNTFRRQAQKQLQHPVGRAHSTPQHQPSQVLQVQQHENHGNQVPLSVPAVTSRMQHGSITLVTLADPATQQNATNSVQSASELDHEIRTYQLNLPDSITNTTTPTSAAPPSRVQQLLSSLPFINWVRSK